MPTPEDAKKFRDAVDAGLTKRNALSPRYVIDYDSEVRDKVLSHKFYKWLDFSPEFNSVVRYLSNGDFMDEYPERKKLELARCVAMVFPTYCFYSSHPEKLARTTKSTKSKALKNTDNLLELLDCDLQMESLSDASNLKILLLRLKLELSGDLPITYPTSSRVDLLSRRLVLDMYYLIKKIFIGEAPIFVIWQLVETIHKVKELQVKRYIKEIE
jgi:hypothetical protein